MAMAAAMGGVWTMSWYRVSPTTQLSGALGPQSKMQALQHHVMAASQMPST